MINRRDFISRSAALAAACSAPGLALAEEKILARPIPGTDELLPVVGMGAPQAFIEMPPEGDAIPRALIHELMRHGGTVIDTPAFNRGSDPVLGPLLTEMGIQDDLFLIGKITVNGKQEGIAHLEWIAHLLNKRPIDLLLVHNMRDLENNWATLRDWKEAGRVRYIGVSLSRPGQQEFNNYAVNGDLERFMKAERPDFIMVPYSIHIPEVGERVLPLAADSGIAVVGIEAFKTNTDGSYFGLVADEELPDWAAEFDCETWAQFQLKWILGNPAMTCVVTETSKPHHAEDNMRAGLGRLPDQDMRERMSEYLLAL
jgi:diketogulonate reductase-like aldo/keto reductase